MERFLKLTLPLIAGLAFTAVCLGQTSGDDRVRPWSQNPSYWQYKGRPVLLVGGSDDDNLFQWPDEALAAQLELLRSVGGNYLRNTMSDRRDKGFEVYPFHQLPDGRYDLEQWNDEYWRRFDRFLRWTSEQDVIVQIEVWDRFDYSREHWIPHPYNPANNVNYGFEESGLLAGYPEHPGSNQQPFFFTTPGQRNNPVLLPFQNRFVEKLLSYSLEYPNILYCIDNETRAEEEWAHYWTGFIRDRAREKGRSATITEMWDDWDIRAERHRQTLDRPDLFDFADLSQNNHNSGELHWDNAVWARRYLERNPRPINSVKVYGADGNRFGHTDQDGVERFWRHLLAGFAAVRFHRPDSGLGLGTKAQASIRAARELERHVALWALTPGNDRLRQRAENEAYLASDPGKVDLVYFPSGGSVEVEVEDGLYDLLWISGTEGQQGAAEAVQAKGTLKLETPNNGHWLAVISPAAAQTLDP